MSISSTLSSMVGSSGTAHGSTENPINSGKNAAPGSGIKTNASAPLKSKLPTGRAPPRAPQRELKLPPQKPSQSRSYSANNPPMGTPQPAPPHPGVLPPYPDARSPQPTLMPNGVPIMPPPAGFVGGLPRVPPSFAPGMSGLLGKLR